METLNLIDLKKFCADSIEKEKCGSEVPIVLLDRGMNPIYEMTSRKNEHGVYVFENVHPVPATVQPPSPYTVRFTVGGKAFLRNFPG